MILRAILSLILAMLAFSAGAAPANGAAVDTAIRSITEAASRTFGKSVSYCTANHLPAGQELEEHLKSYLDAMAKGSRTVMLDIAVKDPSFVSSVPVYSGKDFEMMDKQADAMLQSVKSSPAEACTKLSTIFDAGTTAFFQDFTQQGYQEYLAKRAQYCARSPKPANCK